MNKVDIVALGPGASDLLSQRAMEILQQSDGIYCPRSNGKSYAKEILLQRSIPEEKIICYNLPMSPDRVEAQQVYHHIAEELAQKAHQGLAISLVAEGDVSIYSSSHYISHILEGKGISVRHHAGIPSFIEAASALNISLVEGDETLVVSARKISKTLLDSVALGGTSLVVVKLSLCEDEAKRLIQEYASRIRFYYCSYISRSNAHYEREAEQICKQPFAYFSLLICRSRLNLNN